MSLLANIQAALQAVGADIKALPSKFAALSGSSSQPFSVGAATKSQHAVALGQVLNNTNDPTFADDSIKPASTSWIRRAMSSIATAAGFACSLTPNGYLKLPSWLGGWGIQWCTGISVAAGGISVSTLPIPFPSACFVAFAIGVGTGQGLAEIVSKTTTTVTVGSGNNTAISTPYILAIGY